MPPKYLFNYFKGDWLVKRSFLSKNFESIGSAQGVAKFKMHGNDLFYDENIRLDLLCIKEMKSANQEYIYRYDATLNSISKYFISNAKFYDLVLSQENQTKMQKAYGKHKCCHDLYKASYFFINSSKYILKYYVYGPNKELHIYSEYIRISG